KSLVVKFVGGEKVELVGEVLIHETITFSGRDLSWELDGEAIEKSIELRVRPRSSIQVTEVIGGNSGFRVRLETLRKGEIYRICVTPKNTRNPLIQPIQIRT